MSRGKPDPICWGCGAPNSPGSSECWLCQRRDWNRPGGRRGRLIPAAPGSRRGPASTIAGLMIGIAICGGAIALIREAPGLAVFLLVSVGPALVLTTAKARRRSREGDPMPLWERVARILALSVLIPVLVIVALMIALFAFCSFLGLIR